MDPTKRQPMRFPGRPFHIQCLLSVLRSPLAVEQKARCINFLIGRVSWGKLWKPHSWPPLSPRPRSEEHTSELQSLMRISYAVFCLHKKNINKQHTTTILTYTHSQ